MAYIELESSGSFTQKIMIFAEGTILKPKSLLWLYSHKSYIPIGNAVSIIKAWSEQNVEIVYCTSRREKQAKDVAQLLKQYGFAGTRLYYREPKKRYQDIVEDVQPNVLIEDDCKSIGGSWQMCITQVSPERKASIQSIVVKEFGGIDHLPFSVLDLSAPE